MSADKKVIAAVGAAVSAYLQAEESEKAALARALPKPSPRLWALSGRQEIMRNRQLWQLRMVPR